MSAITGVNDLEGLLVVSLEQAVAAPYACLLYTSPSPRDPKTSRMPSSA